MRQMRFDSLDDLIARTGVRRDELATLAEIGALNAFGYDRRTALWQIERAVKKEGELFKNTEGRRQHTKGRRQETGVRRRAASDDDAGRAGWWPITRARGLRSVHTRCRFVVESWRRVVCCERWTYRRDVMGVVCVWPAP